MWGFQVVSIRLTSLTLTHTGKSRHTVSVNKAWHMYEHILMGHTYKQPKIKPNSAVMCKSICISLEHWISFPSKTQIPASHIITWSLPSVSWLVSLWSCDSVKVGGKWRSGVPVEGQ